MTNVIEKQYHFVIVGCSGFIGSHLVEKLLEQNHKVIGIDNLETGKEENMASFISNENFTFFKKDISDIKQVNDLIALFGYKKLKIDGCFAVAALPRIQPSIQNPGRTFACNVDGTFNVLEMCRALDIKNIVYSASSSAYGITDKLPNHPNDPTNCLNPYSVSKLIGEKLMQSWATCYQMNTVCLRYFNVYGPRSQLSGQYAPIIGLLFRQLLQEKNVMTIVGDGEQTRDMTHVSDVVSANVQAMKKCKEFSSRVFNVGCGKNYSINQIADMINGERTHIPPRPAEARDTLADISDTVKCLEWQPVINLRDGIEMMRKYYEELLRNDESTLNE